MNNKDYTLDELSKVLVEIGKKKHGLDCAYPFAMGTIVGMMDFNIKHRPQEIQHIINEKYAEAVKDLAAA